MTKLPDGRLDAAPLAKDEMTAEEIAEALRRAALVRRSAGLFTDRKSNQP
jgi:hypothetical protein